MYNNEEVGLSAEMAIAEVFSIPVENDYLRRSNEELRTAMLPHVERAFRQENIPRPIQLIAQRQNPVDFILEGGLTLSVKTNQRQLGKVAPQRVGQASSKTFFTYFATVLVIATLPDNYHDRTLLFKRLVYAEIDKMLTVYWLNLFECDYLFYLYEILDRNGSIATAPKWLVLAKSESPQWERHKITFTKTLDNWNESNTVKYDGITIGEFQVHNNRDNFKFRFNMQGLTQLLDKKLI